MPVEYVKEPYGPIHVVFPYGDWEFTVCNRDHGQADEDGFEGTYCKGPATCRECREAYEKLRNGLKGIRWA